MQCPAVVNRHRGDCSDVIARSPLAMQYRLRTLLLVLAIGPPILAWAIVEYQNRLPNPETLIAGPGMQRLLIGGGGVSIDDVVFPPPELGGLTKIPVIQPDEDSAPPPTTTSPPIPK
jgi:hypothetical protein